MQPVQLFLSAGAGIRRDPLLFSSVFYPFPRPLACQDGYQWSLSLKGMSITNSQLVINEYNSALAIDGVAYAVPTGNYDANSLCAALNSATGKTWFFDGVTLKVHMRSPIPVTITGVLASEILDFTEGSNGTDFQSNSTVRLTGVQSIFVDTDLPGSSLSVRGVQGGSSTTLARIPNDVLPLATLHFEDPSAPGSLLFDTSIFGITINLTDELGRPLRCTVPYDITLLFTPVQTGRLSLTVPRPPGLLVPPVMK